MATTRERQHHRPLTVWNETRSVPLVTSGRLARTFWERGVGLLGTSELPAGAGLLIERCSSIHSVGMRFRFDALFLRRDHTVIHRIENMAPNRFSRHLFAAHWVLELPAGVIAATATQLDDVIQWDLAAEAAR